jgi:DNA-binding NarL/FixJ family response regulator
MHAERERLLPLLEAGAHGYLAKEAASRDLVEAIRVVASGEGLRAPWRGRRRAAP